jgi:hypothetical protein
MKPMAKRLLISFLLFIVRRTVGVGPRYALKKKARQKREAGYESTLLSYSQVLKPGMNRKEVEDYLHGKNITVRQMCCVAANELSKRSWDDLTKIGQEDAPWFCSENNVYVAFQFNDHGQHGPHEDANDLDTLKAVSIYHWLA